MTCRVCHREVESFANRNECRDCYNTRMREYMLRRYHERRAWAMELLGGRCVDCWAVKDLEFDHVDRELKEFDIAKVWSYSKVKFEAEIAKCVIRCKECHKARTSEQMSVEHGGGLTGKKNCYCEKCAPLKRAYTNNRRAAKRGRTLEAKRADF